jgi:glutaconyl-CoA/methylmalonyl-CoA decarboxylase subunit gamma
MRYVVTFSTGAAIPVDITVLPTGETQVIAAGRRMSVDTVEHGGATHMCIDGRSVDLWIDGTAPDVGIVAAGRRFRATVESERMRASHAAQSSNAGGDWTVTSPMPGRVIKVLVAEGDAITAGMPLVVVEAMKMENELSCRHSGTVKKIYVSPGATVESGAKLIEIE